MQIDGVEVTQSIQYYRADQHLTDPADRAPDNSVPLVADKPAWVRVYVSSPKQGQDLTCSLDVWRRIPGAMAGAKLGTLAPAAGSQTQVLPLNVLPYAALRGNLAHSVNFVIPATWMQGSLRLVTRVANVTEPPAVTEIRVSAALRQTLRVAFIGVAYEGPAAGDPTGPSIQVAAPTLEAMLALPAMALAMWPVGAIPETRYLGDITVTQPLGDNQSTGGWAQILAKGLAVKSADGDRPGWVYYAAFSPSIPKGTIAGVEWGQLATGDAGQPGSALLFAHEAGHAMGLKHLPPRTTDLDPTPPCYEPYDKPGGPAGSIGEYGLDVRTGEIKRPDAHGDLMGAAAYPWISLYHHARLVGNPGLNPTPVGSTTRKPFKLPRTPTLPPRKPPAP